MAAKTDYATGSWEAWVTRRALVHLKSKKPNLLMDPTCVAVLGDAFPAWLLDRNRWLQGGFGDAWGHPEDACAHEFVIRSTELWPDEDLLSELGRVVGRTGGPPPMPKQGDLLDLLAWWVVVDRGLVPVRNLQVNDPRHRVYGQLIRTRVGYAVFCGLRNGDLACESGDVSVAVAEAYQCIFNTTLEYILDHLYSPKYKILDKSKQFKRDNGEAWGYLHRCIENYVDDFLALKDREVNVPTLSIRDKFRVILKNAQAQISPAITDADGQDEASVTLKLEILGASSEEDPPDDPETSEALRDALARATPVARAALLACHTPPATWDDVAIDALGEDLGLSGGKIVDFTKLIKSHGARLELAPVRTEACQEKAEYLQALTDKTIERLRRVLRSEGHSENQIDERIQILTSQARGREVQLGDLREVLKDKTYTADSQVFLAARLQELIIQVAKMSRYADRYRTESGQGLKRSCAELLPSAEMAELARIFNTTPDDVLRELRDLGW